MMASVFLTLAVCLIAGVIYLRSRKKKLSFPGPKGLPIIGCYFEMQGRPPHELFLEWSQKYGEVFTFSVFGDQYLVASSPEALHELLVTRGNDFGGRAYQYRFDVLTDGFQNIVFQRNMSALKVLRQVAQKTLNIYGKSRGRLEEILNATVDNLTDNFERIGGVPFDPLDNLYEATSLTIITLMSGQQPDNPAQCVKSVRELITLAVDIFSPKKSYQLLDSIPAIRHLPWCPPYHNLMQFKRKEEEICDEIIWPAVERSKSSENPSLGKALLDSVGQSYGPEHAHTEQLDKAGQIDMVNVKQVCLDALMAGVATTSLAFYALLDVFRCHPGIQDSIAEEIDAVVGLDKRVTLGDKNSLHYTQAVVFELFRYCPIVPLAPSHLSRKATQLCGTPVPAGTVIFPNMWGCHHDPKLWDDPWTFKPERFLTDDGQFVAADHPNRKQLFTFGAGTRVCVGELLAINRLILFTANVVRKFRILPADDTSQISCDPRYYAFGQALEPEHFEIRAVSRRDKDIE